jgi:ABC-type sugar transport system permease subunit
MAGICTRCRARVADDEAFCGNCGQPTGVRTAGAGAATPTMAGTAASAAVTGVRPGADIWPASHGVSALDRAAAGLAGVHIRDVGYTGPEDSFDPLGNRRLLWQFFIHWLLYSLAYTVLAAVFALIFAILAVAGLGVRAFVLWYIGAALVGLLFFCLFWLIPVPAMLSEWKFLIDHKASAAPVIFDHIAWALQQRQTPLDEAKVRRLKLAAGEGRDYLEIRRGLFSGLICCFAYGEDLYVAWSFWLRVSPLRCLLMFLARLWQTVMRRGTDLYVTLRYDYAKAMREAMDHSTRQGVEVAMGESHAQGHGTASSLQVAVTDLAL